MELPTVSTNRRFIQDAIPEETQAKRKIKKTEHGSETANYPIIYGTTSRVVAVEEEKTFDPFDDSLLSEKAYAVKYPFGRLQCHKHCQFASKKFSDVNIVFSLDKYIGGRQCVCLDDPADRRLVAETPYLLYIDDLRAAFDYRSRELYDGQKLFPLDFFISTIAKAAVIAVCDLNEMLQGDCGTPNCSTKEALTYQRLHLLDLINITPRAEPGTRGPFDTVFCKDKRFYSTTLRKQTE